MLSFLDVIQQNTTGRYLSKVIAFCTGLWEDIVNKKNTFSLLIMKKFSQIMFFAMLLGIYSDSFADGNFKVAQSAVFAGINTGWTSLATPDLPASSASNHNFNLGGTLGYQYALNKALSTGVEANYSTFGKTTYSSSSSSGHFGNTALQILLSGTYLLDNGFNTFIKFGAAHEESEIVLNDNTSGLNSWLPAAAAGLGYDLLENLNIYGQYEHTFGRSWKNAEPGAVASEPTTLNVFSLGLNYSFPM